MNTHECYPSLRSCPPTSNFSPCIIPMYKVIKLSLLRLRLGLHSHQRLLHLVPSKMKFWNLNFVLSISRWIKRGHFTQVQTRIFSYVLTLISKHSTIRWIGLKLDASSKSIFVLMRVKVVAHLAEWSLVTLKVCGLNPGIGIFYC